MAAPTPTRAPSFPPLAPRPLLLVYHIPLKNVTGSSELAWSSLPLGSRLRPSSSHILKAAGQGAPPPRRPSGAAPGVQHAQGCALRSSLVPPGLFWMQAQEGRGREPGRPPADGSK